MGRVERKKGEGGKSFYYVLIKMYFKVKIFSGNIFHLNLVLFPHILF